MQYSEFNRQMISIHAPRRGSDTSRIRAAPGAFISIHAPRMGSDRQRRASDNKRRISIHAPRMGSDHEVNAHHVHPSISIHAPRMGSDMALSIFAPALFLFQSTLPAWGATKRPEGSEPNILFQSTLPAWGATAFPSASVYSNSDFNPRSPHGERHFNLTVSVMPFTISIHAPRMGSDIIKILNQRWCDRFQSTLPAWGATVQPKHTAMTA